MKSELDGTSRRESQLRRDPEEELRRFRAAMDVSADLMFLLDPVSFRYIDVNDTACRALGYSREELLAMGPQDIFSKSRDDLVQLYDRIRSGDLLAPVLERVCRCKDGSQLLIEMHPRAVRHASGDFIVCIARDIREHRRAEALLRLEHAVTQCLSDADSLGPALKAAIRAICETENWECGRYLHVDKRAGVLRVGETWGIQTEAIQRFLDSSRAVSYAPGAGLAGRVWQSGEPLWLPDIGNDSRAAQTSLIKQLGLHGAVFFPLIAKGEMIGMLLFNSREVREPEERLLQAMRVIGSQIGQFVQRKQAEEVLRERESRYRALAELSTDGFWALDRDGRIIEVNDRYLKRSGYSREELLTMSVYDIDAQQSSEEVRAILAKSDDSSNELFESRHRAKDGSIWPVEISTILLADAGGRRYSFLRDITERKRAEQAIKQLSRKNELLLSSVGQGIYGVDVEGNTTFINPAAENLLGYRAEELIGKPMHSILHHTKPDGSPYPREECPIYKAFRDGNVHHVDNEVFWRKDGTAFPVEYTSTPIRDENNTLIGAVAVFNNITERKRMEEQVRQLAFYDTLTRLPNRRLLNDRLSQAMADSKRSGCYGALMFLDLDNFKSLNDMHGHEAGDLLLIEAANRLKSCLRERDTIARLGGDEFVVLIKELSVDKSDSTRRAGIVAEKLREALAKAYVLKIAHEGEAAATVEHHCTVSIGVASFLRQEASQDDLLKRADAAMYQAKEAGRNLIRFDDSST